MVGTSGWGLLGATQGSMETSDARLHLQTRAKFSGGTCDPWAASLAPFSAPPGVESQNLNPHPRERSTLQRGHRASQGVPVVKNPPAMQETY